MELISVVLILLGIALLVAEIFIPSFGITGLLGIISIIGGIVLTASSVGQGIVMFLVILIVVMVLMFFSYRYVVTRKSSLILTDVLNEETSDADLKFFLKKRGVALTILRPAGKGDFDGVRLDVMTEGDFIKKGTGIIVSRIEGKKIFVRENQTEGELHE